MNNKLLKTQLNINKIIKTSKLPFVKEDECEIEKTKEKLSIQLKEALKVFIAVNKI